jgi:hypothetical protein
MKRKKLVIILGIIAIILISSIVTYIKLKPIIFPSYTECVEINWKIKLPKPHEVILVGSTRGGLQGDGDEINELIYNDAENLQDLNNSFKWFNYENIPFKISYNGIMLLGDRERINDMEIDLSGGNPQKIIEKLNKEAKYFYMDKNDKSDFIIFILEGNKLTIYESYR